VQLKNLCVSCEAIITAPLEKRGLEVACPRCGAANVMLAAEDLEDQEQTELARERLHELKRASPVALAQAPAVRRLRDLSDLLLLFSYVAGLLGLIGGAIPLLSRSLATEWQLLGVTLGGLVAVILFLTFRFLSELVQSQAEQLGRQMVIEEQLRGLRRLLGDG